MTVHGLVAQGESIVRLHPNARPDQYLRRVRELISGHVLGSPGGYPVYLQRWTRMGQMRDESLAQLLLLGEPEAVVAAVCSPGLTDELARRAWWAMEDAENARRMLCSPAIVAGQMGPVLAAAYLIDYLPFETESERIMESVRLVLQPGLIQADQREDLWRKSARRGPRPIWWVFCRPSRMPCPDPDPPRVRPPGLAAGIESLVETGNECARLLHRVKLGSGQTWLKTVAAVLAKPPSQDVVTTSFDCLRDYFSALRPEGDPNLSMEDLSAEAETFASPEGPDAAVVECLAQWPELAREVSAMRILSGLGYGVIRPVLSDLTALGTLMRRKLRAGHRSHPGADPRPASLGLDRAEARPRRGQCRVRTLRWR